MYPPDYKGQLLSDTVPAYLMLYMQARKQPKDLTNNCFQKSQIVVVVRNL